jgi:hypothetical protein
MTSLQILLLLVVAAAIGFVYGRWIGYRRGHNDAAWKGQGLVREESAETEPTGAEILEALHEGAVAVQVDARISASEVLLTFERCAEVRAARISPTGECLRSWRGIAAFFHERWSVAWIRCQCCEGHRCIIHGMHVHDCPCLPIEDWAELEETSPYAVGSNHAWDPPDNQIWGMALCEIAAQAHGEDYRKPPWN